MRTIEDIDSKYLISPDGFILNSNTGRNVVFSKDSKGYMKARLYSPLSTNPDKRKPYRLHRLVAKAFLENFSDKLQVNHKDGDKTNNSVENLEMVTASENVYHAWNNLDNAIDRKNKISRDEKGRFKKS
jgi:hypothetical protein